MMCSYLVVCGDKMLVIFATAAAAASTNSRILLVRHGETNFNAAGRLQGRLESELTDKGHAQAKKLGAWMAEHISIDRTYVSPRKRTRQTLGNVNVAFHAKSSEVLPVAEVRAGLREIELTVWEGQLKEDLKNRDDVERWAQWKATPSAFIFEEDGHAPLMDLFRRASEEWTFLRESTPPGSTSLVVAHGAFNRAFMLAALGLPLDDHGFQDDRFSFENCALVELQWPPGASHATAWRKRYPAQSEWITREQELERRAASSNAAMNRESKLEL